MKISKAIFYSIVFSLSMTQAHLRADDDGFTREVDSDGKVYLKLKPLTLKDIAKPKPAGIYMKQETHMRIEQDPPRKGSGILKSARCIFKKNAYSSDDEDVSGIAVVQDGNKEITLSFFLSDKKSEVVAYCRKLKSLKGEEITYRAFSNDKLDSFEKAIKSNKKKSTTSDYGEVEVPAKKGARKN